MVYYNLYKRDSLKTQHYIYLIFLLWFHYMPPLPSTLHYLQVFSKHKTRSQTVGGLVPFMQYSARKWQRVTQLVFCTQNRNPSNMHIYVIYWSTEQQLPILKTVEVICTKGVPYWQPPTHMPACHFYHLSLKNPVKNCINTNQSHRQCDTWHLSTNGNYLSYKQSDAYLKRVAFLGCLWLITTVTAIQVCLYVFVQGYILCRLD